MPFVAVATRIAVVCMCMISVVLVVSVAVVAWDIAAANEAGAVVTSTVTQRRPVPRRAEVPPLAGEYISATEYSAGFVTGFRTEYIETAVLSVDRRDTQIRSSVLLDVPLFSQRELGLPTGCEIVSLAMMIDYVNPGVDVRGLLAKMPLSQNPYEGFRGNPNTTGGFTIFPPALMALTEEYLGSAHDMSGYGMIDLKEKLNAGAPVVVWVVGLGWNVHVVTLSGYNEEGFFYNDPWTGVKDTFITFDDFYAIWNTPIRDNILNRTSEPRKALSFHP